MTAALVGLLAQVLHIVLLTLAAPTLRGIQQALAARLAGRAGPHVSQPWRDLKRLWRKTSVMAESASPISIFAPLAGAAATIVAACLVPSFTLGMAFAPCADLLTIFGLLIVARYAGALAAMDAGTASGGAVASQTSLLVPLAVPAMLLVLFVLGLLTGSLGADLVVAMQGETVTDWHLAAPLAFAAILLVALIDSTQDATPPVEFSGRELALLEATGMLRLLVWCNLIGALFLPFGMAPSGGGLLAWLVGALCWLARTALLMLALVLAQWLLGRLRLVRMRGALGVAVVLAALAALFLFANMGAA